MWLLLSTSAHALKLNTASASTEIAKRCIFVVKLCQFVTMYVRAPLSGKYVRMRIIIILDNYTKQLDLAMTIVKTIKKATACLILLVIVFIVLYTWYLVKV